MHQNTDMGSLGDSNSFQEGSPEGGSEQGADTGAEFGFGAGIDASVDERPAPRRKKAARKTSRKRGTSASTATKKAPPTREGSSGGPESESRGDSDSRSKPTASRTRRRKTTGVKEVESGSDSSETETGSEDAAPRARAPRKKKAATRSRSTKKKTTDRGTDSEAEAGPSSEDVDGEERRPRRRGRRKASASSAVDGDHGSDEVPEQERGGDRDPGRRDSTGDERDGEEEPRGRRRGRRGGRRRRDADSEGALESADGEREAPGGEARGSESEEEEGRSRGGRDRGSAKRSSKKRRGDEGRRTEEPEDDSGSDGDEAPASKKRGRRRKAKRSESEDRVHGEETRRDSESDREDEEPRSGTRRRRGLRGGRRRSSSGQDDKAPVEIEAIPFDDDDLPALEEESDDRERGSRAGQKSRGGSKSKEDGGRAKKKASRKSKKVDEDEPEVPVDPPNKNVILVNAKDHDELRVAVVEDELITDFQMTVHRHKTLVNDIYRGRVVNLEPAIGAAFVDFGQGRNGFLHTSDVLSVYGEKDWSLEKLLTTRIDPEEWDGESSQPDVSIDLDDSDDNGSPSKSEDDEDGDDSRKKSRSKKSRGAKSKTGRGKSDGKKGKKGGKVRRHARPRLPISDLLKKGQSVVVQITKDAIGDKGPTLTTYISIPGRYLVLMPSMARTGVSRKIEDERERRRLKRILKGMKIPEGMGVIVRTAGVGQTKRDLQRDLDYLLLMWEDFDNRLTLGRGPLSLYQESDVGLRTMRDLFTPGTEKVVVDDEELHGRMVEFTKKLMPEQVDRIVLHDQKRPLFHAYGIEQDFERIFSRRVELPSGGSIVFDQAEALVAIDVNSGKTRSDGFDFEEIALKTNLEAVPEIARQIRLRDLGGIIVCDFIDMMRTANRRAVEKALRDSLSGDRARAKLGRISQFGLLELTRQRLGAGMGKMLFQNCVHCRGTGVERTPESRAIAILRRLGSALTLKGFSKVEVRAHPDSIEAIQRLHKKDLDELKALHDRTLVFTEVPDQLEDSVFRYLRADGREVRPGGRRKR